ncbi:MAG: tetratricopeptide repeat protein [Gemmatimonadaceae bacterium]|nr:tetratricopeptide repeat protein [Gemmatimonadaceae bacterium]
MRRPLLTLVLLLAPLSAGAQRTPRDSAAIDSLVWLGRRVSYLGLYDEAIAVYAKALERFPGDPQLLRHRGHRYISVRRFDAAIADLAAAGRAIAGTPDAIEPDGQPNAKGIPVSTLHFNIWYHLGLAHWLAGDAEAARVAYEQCLAVSRNDDSRVAARYWLWQIYTRLGRAADARAMTVAARTETAIIENDAYARLLALFDGRLTEAALRPTASGAAASLADATTGYGIGAWHLANGRRDAARATWRAVLEASGQRASFGALAAAAELARLDAAR